MIDRPFACFQIDKRIGSILKVEAKITENIIFIIPKYIKFRGELNDKIRIKHFPDLKKIQNTFKKYGAIESEISGSGPTIYGIFNEKMPIDQIKNELKEKIDFIWPEKEVNGKINSNKTKI